MRPCGPAVRPSVAARLVRAKAPPTRPPPAAAVSCSGLQTPVPNVPRFTPVPPRGPASAKANMTGRRLPLPFPKHNVSARGQLQSVPFHGGDSGRSCLRPFASAGAKYSAAASYALRHSISLGASPGRPTCDVRGTSQALLLPGGPPLRCVASSAACRAGLQYRDMKPPSPSIDSIEQALRRQSPDSTSSSASPRRSRRRSNEHGKTCMCAAVCRVKRRCSIDPGDRVFSSSTSSSVANSSYSSDKRVHRSEVHLIEDCSALARECDL